MIIVDEKGNEIDGDKIIALFAKHLIKFNKSKFKYPIVTTVMSNIGLENYILNKFKVNLKRSSVGDINVIKEMQKNNMLRLFGIAETNGAKLFVSDHARKKK